MSHALDTAEKSSTKTDWRLNATIDRLISNLPAACKVLLEEGNVNLAGQLARDQRNLMYWQERGILTFQQHPEEPISNTQQGE